MITIVWLLLRAQSLRRLTAVASCGAATTITLMITTAILLLPAQPPERLFDVVRDPGTRGGVVLALLLLLAPVLVLAYQVVLLGSTTRSRRLAVLHVTGATPVQVKLLGATLSAVPAGIGALLGVPGFFLLRSVLGGTMRGSDPTMINIESEGALQLIPASVTPAPWQILVIVAATTATVASMGWHLSGRAGAMSAVTIIRRTAPRLPRPWGLVPVGAAFVGFTLTLITGSDSVIMLPLVVLAAIGLMATAPWIAHRAGVFGQRRATSVSALLGSSRLTADPWSAGRAAAPITVIGLVMGGAAMIVALLVVDSMLEAFYVISVVLVVVLLLIALIFVAFAIAAHGVETLAEHRRSIASLVATGTPPSEIERSLAAEATLVAVPSIVTGLLLGSLPLLGLALGSYEDNQGVIAAGLVALLVAFAVGVTITRIAIVAATRMVRPWLRLTTSPDNLRTE